MDGPRERGPHRLGKRPAQRGGLVLRAPGAEEGARHRGQSLADGDDLLRGLALAEDHLRLPLPERAVVVYPREGEIFERKMAQPLERRIRCQASGRDLGEHGLELLGSHATWATGSRYSRKIASASATD